MKCYDKEMIRALKDGSVIELDSNSLHNHLEQPGNEYWERREVGFCANPLISRNEQRSLSSSASMRTQRQHNCSRRETRFPTWLLRPLMT